MISFLSYFIIQFQKIWLFHEFRGPVFIRGDRLPALGVSSFDRRSWVCA